MMLILAARLLAAASAVLEPSPLMRCDYDIVGEFPHDAGAFTQGLFWHRGNLYESTGHYGRSRIARIDLQSGAVSAQAPFPADQFGEGIARWRDQIIGVTWRNGIGHRWRLRDLEPLAGFRYDGEGWGLTLHEDLLVLSDGTAALRFFDPATMEEKRRVTVRFGGRPLSMLNELEAIDGEIWANVWMSDMIVRIDPDTGVIGSYIDLSGLKEKAGARGQDAVLNGIAWDGEGRRLFVTGKNWPKLYEITVAACR